MRLKVFFDLISVSVLMYNHCFIRLSLYYSGRTILHFLFFAFFSTERAVFR